MADIKQFNLKGVGNDVQLGKQGPRIQVDGQTLKVTESDGNTLTRAQGADGIDPTDFTTVNQLNAQLTAVNGASIALGIPSDTSLTDGAIPFQSTDKVTDAIDRLNEVLGLLVPTSPPTWPGTSAFTLSGVNTLQLANGAVTNNSGTALPSAGGNVSTILTSSISSTIVGGIGDAGAGPGDSGTITALLNGTSVGARVLTSGTDNGTYNRLVISGDVSFPAITPGFWQVVRAQISNAVLPAGYSKLQLTHSGASNTPEQFVLYDNVISGLPTLSSLSISSSAATSLSSSIPHYNTAGVVSIAGTANNLAGLSYRRTGILNIVGTASSAAYVAPTGATPFNTGSAGIPEPLAVGATGVAFSADVVLSNVHTLGRLQIQASNPVGTSGLTTISSPQILVMGTASTTFIDEDNVLVNGEITAAPVSTNAARVVTVNGDTPNWTFTGTTTDWNPATLAVHDATVAGGILQHDVTNYSTGYLPVGPNLSSQNSAQYITFMFRRTPLSKFDIQISGTVAGCWVKLPGVTTSTYAGNNEWRDMSVPFGSGFGCALAGVLANNTLLTAARRTCSFGTDSSSAATNNIVLVRIRLNAGQRITALQFRSASN